MNSVILSARSLRKLVTTERGAMAIWAMGLLLLLFFAGGMALDLWRVLSRHGTAAAIADKAAAAGAGELDEDALRAGELRLAGGEAEQAAQNFARSQPAWNPDSMSVHAQSSIAAIEVIVSDQVELTLLAMFAPPQGVTVQAAATAYPRWAG